MLLDEIAQTTLRSPLQMLISDQASRLMVSNQQAIVQHGQQCWGLAVALRPGTLRSNTIVADWHAQGRSTGQLHMFTTHHHAFQYSETSRADDSQMTYQAMSLCLPFVLRLGDPVPPDGMLRSEVGC